MLGVAAEDSKHRALVLEHCERGTDLLIVTVAVECLPMYDSTNGIISAVAKCGVDSICQ